MVVVLLVAIGFFYQTFTKGLLPVPSDTLVGLYHPWRDAYESEYPRGIPFKNFLITDPIRQQIPWRAQVIGSWKSGQIPWWNPTAFSGVPLAANIQAAAFYPLNILFLVLDFSVAWTWLIMLQPLLAGIFFYGFLRTLGHSRMASALGALAWSFSGFMVAWMTWGTIGHAALWLPLALLAVDKITIQKGKIKWAALFSVSIILSWLAGHAQVALYGTLVSIVYAIYRHRRVKENLFWLGCGVIAAAVLLFAQLGPFVQLVEFSSRASQVDGFLKPGWFVPWPHLVQFLVPDFFGNPATLNYWGEWNYGEFVGYIGVLPFMFSLVGLFLGGKKYNFWHVSLGLSLFLMLPSPLTRSLYQLKLPIFNSLQPTRLMMIVDLTLSVLVAAGVDVWRQGKNRRVLGVAFVLELGYMGIWLFMFLGQSAFPLLAAWQVARRNLILPGLLSGLGVGLIFLGQRFAGVGKKRILISVVLLLAIFDLYRFGWKFTPFTPQEYFFPETATISFLKSQPKPFRVATIDDRLLPPNVTGYYGLETINGYDPLIGAPYERLASVSERSEPGYEGESGFNRIIVAKNFYSPIWGLMDIEYLLSLEELNDPSYELVMSEGETRVYRNLKNPGRIFFVESVDKLPLSKHLEYVFGAQFAPTRTAATADLELTTSPVSPDEYASVLSYDTGELIVDYFAKEERFIFVSLVNYPGWRATVDGSAVALRKTNYLFCGVVVPAGRHTLRVFYKPDLYL